MGIGHSAPRADQLWLIATEGQLRRDLVAEVAVRARTRRIYSYAVPLDLAERIRPGVGVQVPFGRAGRLTEGWCVRVTQQAWEHTLKPIASVTREEPILNPPLLELALWISRYYACAPGLVLEAMAPAAVRQVRLRRVRYVRAVGQPDDARLSQRQRAILAALAGGELPRGELLERTAVRPATLRSLRNRALVEFIERREPLPPAPEPPSPLRIVDRLLPSEADSYTLTAGQQAALDALRPAADATPQFRVFLLFGVPGSGKTEVYVRAMQAVVAAGRQAILLAPEIALSTQVAERLAARFQRVAVLHSRLSPAARREALRAIAAGDVDVVIGTRTAVFAPCPRLGLIVVDEEQEATFKNLAAPYFHARDVAIKRGQLENVPVALGSATPALETWHNATELGRYELLRLPQRVPGAVLPRVRLVQTGRRELGQTSALLSVELIQRMREVLAAGRQVILLHNRRGYAACLRCARCGLTVCCARCGARLVYHRADESLKCHRCGLRRDVPANCLDDSCRGRLERSSPAIQRLEQELRHVYPTARLQRLDSDVVHTRADYEQALGRFARHESDVLLGTQMVAKGLDFPHVRLVGVVDADALLSLPDLRASERTFQLIVQVVGRAGRREGESTALIQTRDARAPAIQHALHLDYESFAREELSIRKALHEPPYVRLVRLVCADATPSRARQAAQQLAEALRALAGRVDARIIVDDPEPCVIARLRELHRWQVLVRTPRDASAQRLLHQADRARLLSPKVKRFTIDVDPVDLL